jgi:hypothetical protein
MCEAFVSKGKQRQGTTHGVWDAYRAWITSELAVATEGLGSADRPAVSQAVVSKLTGDSGCLPERQPRYLGRSPPPDGNARSLVAALAVHGSDPFCTRRQSPAGRTNISRIATGYRSYW